MTTAAARIAATPSDLTLLTVVTHGSAVETKFRDIFVGISGVLVGWAGTVLITVYQDRAEAMNAAPDLALSCDDTRSDWQRQSPDALIFFQLDASDFSPGRHNAAELRFIGPHYPPNLPKYLKRCVVRNDGDQVARRIVLAMEAMIQSLGNDFTGPVVDLPFTVGFDAIPGHSQGEFLIANANAGSGNLSASGTVTYQVRFEASATAHPLTVLNFSRYLHPDSGPCKPSVPGRRWPPIEC